MSRNEHALSIHKKLFYEQTPSGASEILKNTLSKETARSLKKLIVDTTDQMIQSILALC
ncbi:hypothetical protein KVM23_00790 [Helicobacter pylori]|nr:hypothetical protein KVM23_00790 [Helicobacter pylori]